MQRAISARAHPNRIKDQKNDLETIKSDYVHPRIFKSHDNNSPGISHTEHTYSINLQLCVQFHSNCHKVALLENTARFVPT